MRRPMRQLPGAALVIGVMAVCVHADGPNLISNGGFEAFPSGWAEWRADWSTGYNYDYRNRTAGCSGVYCLKLTATNASFGVYKTVAVTPGRYYRFACKWKASFTHTANNWAEIEIIPGPFDIVQADQRPDDLIHKMYSYDAPPGATPITFDWVLTPALNDLASVDFNDYDGIRYSGTKSVMTVVLKAGATSGQTTQEWFDDVMLCEVRKDPADFDVDADVDLDDFSRLQACFNGPNRPILASCWDADLDSDGDVDLVDFGMFQGCFNGPNNPPRCPSAF